MKQLYFWVALFLWQFSSLNLFAQQASLIKDVRPGNMGSKLKELVVMNGIVYFTADDGTHGRELWRSDGTANGTYMVKDIHPGSGQSFINNLTVMNGKLYFAAYEPIKGGELWRSDGTANGTVLVEDENAGNGGIDPISLMNVNGTLYFVGNAIADKKTIYRSNGNSVEEVAVFTDQAGFEVEIAGYNSSHVFIDVYEASSFGDLLYSININSKAVSLVLGNLGPYGVASIQSYFMFNNRLYFYVDDYLYGLAYSYDGMNLDRVTNSIHFYPDDWWGTPVEFSSVGDKLIVRYIYYDEQLGGPVSSSLIDVNTSSNEGSTIKGFGDALIHLGSDAELNGALYFGMSDFYSDVVSSSYGNSYLYRTDGTADGTYRVKTLSSDGRKFIREMAVADGKLFFTMDSDSGGYELWKSDGTENGTNMIINLGAGGQNGEREELIGLDKTLFFTADDGSIGRELWKYAPEVPNRPPTSSNNTINATEDKAYTFSVNDFPFSDADAGDELFVVKLNQLASKGTLFFDANNNNAPDNNELMANGWEVFARDFAQLKYIAPQDENGDNYATFQFQVSDGKNYDNDQYTMTIDVAEVNDAPSFSLNQASLETIEDAGQVGIADWAENISAGASNESGQSLTFNVDVLQKDGTLIFENAPTIDADGKLSFQTSANAYGNATVQVTLEDNGSDSGDNENKSASQSFEIKVAPSIDGKPKAQDTETKVNEAAEGITILPSEADANSIPYFQITNIQNGSLSLKNGTELTNGYFITAEQGAQGLVFTPLLNSLVTGSFDVQAALDNNADALGGEVATVNISVQKGQAAFELSNLQQTYDGTPKDILVKTIPEGLDYTITYNGENTPPTNAGAYEVIVTIAEAAFEGSKTEELTILPAQAEITISNTAQSFDATAKSITVTTVPEGLDFTVLYNGQTTLPTAVGEYEVTVEIDEQNYVGEAAATLTIEEQPVVIQIANLEQVFDGTEKSVIVSTVPDGLPTTITYNGEASLPVDAGTYQVKVEATQFGIVYSKEVTLTISKAKAEVAISDTLQAFDNTPKSVTVKTSPEGIEYIVLYNGAAESPSAIGEHEVKVEVTDKNYEGAASAILSIEEDPLIIEISNLQQTYDGTAKSVEVSTDPTALPITVSYNGEATPPTEVGTYNVLVKVERFGIEYTREAVLIIEPAQVNILVFDTLQVFDGLPKEVTVETTPTNILVKVLYNGTEMPPVNAGSYRVTISSESPNYLGSYEGTLEIEKAEAEIIFSELTHFYNGTAKSGIVETSPAALQLEILYDNNTTLPVEIGEYTLFAKIVEANYKGEATANFRIIEEKVEFAIEDSVAEYNENGVEFTVKTFPEDIPLTITYDGSEEKPVNAGTYQVVITAELNGNTYTKETTWTIEKQAATFSVANTVQIYDGTLKPLLVQTEPAGLNYKLTYNGSEETPINAGQYTYQLIIEEDNYQGEKSGSFEIEKAEGTITLNQREYVFSGKEITLDYSTNPEGLQVDFTFNGSAEIPFEVGSYQLKAEINDINYAGSLSDTLNIVEVTGFIDNGLKVSLSVYPNPTLGQLIVEDGSEELAKASVLLYTSAGQFVHSWLKPLNRKEITLDLSEQPTGVYLIHFIKNGKHAVFNIVKK